MREAFSEALVGVTLAKKWGWKVGDRVPIGSSIFSQKNGSRSWDMTIVGIFGKRKPQADTNRMFFHYDYLNETRSFGNDKIGWLVLQTTSPDVNDRVAKAIDRSFANSSYETATDTEKAFNKAFVAQSATSRSSCNWWSESLRDDPDDRRQHHGDGRGNARAKSALKTLGFSGGRVLRLVLGEPCCSRSSAAFPASPRRGRHDEHAESMATTGTFLGPSILAIALLLMISLGLATASRRRSTPSA
jgi:putative ABC transport system permease protein